jgi:SAM-dependent methyltransferase
VEFEFLAGQEYILAECARCGLIYQVEIPNGALMHRLYEKWIDPAKVFDLYERNREIGSFAQAAAEIVEAVRYFNAPQNQLRFLDYSMGWGHWCRVAKAFGCPVEGTEFNAACLEYARHTGIPVVDGNALSPESYDFINVSQVLEHVPEPRKTLSQLKAALKPTGIIRIGVPDGWDIRERLLAWNWSEQKGGPQSLNAVAPLEHINCFNHHVLMNLAAAVGLELVDTAPQIVPRKRPLTAVKAVLRPWYRRIRRVLGQEVPPGNKGTNLNLRIRRR